MYMENQRTKYDIFISYESTTGESFANHLKIALERRKGHKHKVFLANETLAAGDKFGNKIESALNECKYFIVVITSLTMDCHRRGEGKEERGDLVELHFRKSPQIELRCFLIIHRTHHLQSCQG